jgi:hypothetical protein
MDQGARRSAPGHSRGRDRTDPDDPIPTALMLAQTMAKPADADSVPGLLTAVRTACGEEPAPLDHARLCAIARCC